jgi:hypothetical protein
MGNATNIDRSVFSVRQPPQSDAVEWQARGSDKMTKTSEIEWFAMMHRHKFKVGQHVRLSQYGKDCSIGPKARRDQSGVVVTKVDEFNSLSVRWEGRKTASRYFPGFIEPDRRRTQS